MPSATSLARPTMETAEPRAELSSGTLPTASGTRDLRAMSPEILAELHVYQRLGAVSAEALAPLLGRLDSEPAELSADDVAGSRCAQLVMSSVTLEAELTVSLHLESAREGAFAEAALGDGDAPPELVDDLLRELANIVGGVVRMAAMEEGCALRGHLPSAGESPAGGERLAKRSWRLSGADGGIRIAVDATVGRRANVIVSARELHEGMAMAREIRSSAGEVLAGEGARLTATGAAQLAEAIGPTQEVDVAVGV